TVLAISFIVAIGVLGLVGRAQAQQYPSQDLHLISAFPAGSGADVLVRYFAEKLRPLSGRTIIVENKAGAGGNIATEYVARSKPDGYTIFVHAGNTLASNYHLIRNNPVDASKQIQIAATINRQAFMLVVDAKSPWKTMADLTAHLKERGEKATYATAANSGVIMCAIYKELAGLKAVEVDYKMAGDSLNDMASGNVDFGCHDPVFALSQVREGRLRVLAVASKDRLNAAPDYPSMTEAGYPMDLAGWFAAMVPVATPRPIVDQINTWFNQIHAQPETAKFLTNFGGDSWVSTPDEGQARLLKDIKDWVEYVRIAKLQPQG
ncbi:MAG: Bug family tripartite tricarboxylate transporter substrate binding protein, partial [Xanthobacteraceae bacterium]